MLGTIVLQGPVYDSNFVTDNYNYYSSLGYQVIVSTWESNGKWQEDRLPPNVLTHIGKMQYQGVVISNKNNLLSLEQNTEVFTPVPSYYQSLGILNGLSRLQKTSNVIKIRTDEYYSDLSILQSALDTDNQRFISSNTFARTYIEQPFHPSDHIFASSWSRLYNMAKTVINYFRLNKSVRGKCVYDYYPPETTLARAFLLGNDISMEREDEELYHKHFMIIPIEHFGKYIVKANSRKETFTNI